MVQRNDVTWLVLDGARPCLEDLRAQLGEDAYGEERNALQDFLCAYFDSGSCRHRLGKSIAPLASTTIESGGKCLKVRWATPGSGKSGGLRLAVVAYCDTRVVKVAGAWQRRDDPTDEQFDDAFAGG